MSPVTLARTVLKTLPLALLAACAQAPHTLGQGQGWQGVAAISPANVPAPAPSKPAMVETAQPAVVPRLPEPIQLNPAPNPTALVDPSRFKGLTSREVISLLGAPGFQRRDTPAEIWQYRSRVCTLDLFLYDSGVGEQRVDHWAVRGPDRLNETDCVRHLLEQSRTSQSGS